MMSTRSNTTPKSETRMDIVAQVLEIRRRLNCVQPEKLASIGRIERASTCYTLKQSYAECIQIGPAIDWPI